MNSRVTSRARARSLRWLACGVVAIVALLVAAAGASAHGPDPIFAGRWTQSQSLSFSWRAGSVPAAAYQTAIKAAAGDVNTTRGSQAATFTYAAGSASLIGYGAGATCGPLGIACFSRNPPTSFTMWMREQGHRFDWGPLRWCQAYASPPNGCFDVENIMLDEFGHVEMLNHHDNLSSEADYLDAVVQTKSRARPQAGWNAHALGRCDVASLQVQYDMQSWGARYSTCLDLSTTLTLTGGPRTVWPGDTVALKATLKVSDVASYVRLGLNPIALRTVTLQQRPTGTTAWTTVGVMAHSASSGSYTRSLVVTANTEFRAVFARPADEGLRDATSAIVSIVVQSNSG